jgi:hypothetical protein
MNSADSDSNDGHLGPRSDREWRRQYGPAIGAEVVQRLPCGWRRGCRSLRAKLCFDRGNVFQYWRTKLEEACVSCFAPQIPAWNDSDGEALALVFAQEHGAGLEAWQTRSHREDSDSVNPGSNPGPSARESASNRCVFVVSSLAGIVPKLPRVSSPANASAATRDAKCLGAGRERPQGLSRPFSSRRMWSVSAGF